ncbi:hypothetical protein ACIA2T_15715 [Amycolatopsis japonica]|uniref:hypothetical protein n=1 Tax=Amycolatopsis japonica TaxID=208439 RepID=UPI0037BD29E4
MMRGALVMLSATTLAVVPPVAGASAQPSAATAPSTAAAYTVSPGTSVNVNARVVVLPGMTVPLSITLGNYSATPSQARVRFRAKCITKDIDFLTVWSAPQVVTVPGDPANPPKGGKDLKTVSASITLPATCAPQPDSGPISHDGDFAAEMGPAVGEPTGLKQSLFWIGKPFTYTNYRYNLELQTHGAPAESAAHHTLPRKFEAKFNKAGIPTIHDPIYLRWWCSRPGVPGNHPSKAAEYNALWDTFFAQKPNPTAAEVLAYRASIQGRYTYTCPPKTGPTSSRLAPQTMMSGS